MLTIFSIPKPFAGAIDVIQRNAIASWRRLADDVEILLGGDEPGTAETAARFGTGHLPDIERNAFGTPLLHSAFDQARRRARHRLLAYVNADILLLSDFRDAVAHLAFPDFLMVGQRWDLDLAQPLDFDRPDWEHRLRADLRERGQLHPPAGSDVFVFARDSELATLPPFAVGRPGWDNWLIYRARQLGIPVVDATGAVTIVHQNHDYRHVPGGDGASAHGPEAEAQLARLPDRRLVCTIHDATHVLAKRGPRRAWRYPYLRQRLLSQSVLHPNGPVAALVRGFRRGRWAARGRPSPS